MSGALRARDASRPRPEDVEAAERDLVIVRRHYVPADTLPGTDRAPGRRPAPPATDQDEGTAPEDS